MSQVPGRGFIIYNNTEDNLAISANVDYENKDLSPKIQLISKTYSKLITFNSETTSNQDIVFEILNPKTFKRIGLGITIDEFYYDKYGDVYLLELNQIDKTFVLKTKEDSFSRINFYNSALSIAKFQLYELPSGVKLESKNLGKLYWQSKSLRKGQDESIDVKSLNIEDMTLLAVKASVTLGVNDIYNTPIIYLKEKDKAIGFKLTGTSLTSKIVSTN